VHTQCKFTLYRSSVIAHLDKKTQILYFNVFFTINIYAMPTYKAERSAVYAFVRFVLEINLLYGKCRDENI